MSAKDFKYFKDHLNYYILAKEKSYFICNRGNNNSTSSNFKKAFEKQ